MSETLWNCFVETVRRDPARAAIIQGDDHVSFEQWMHRSLDYVSWLGDAGLCRHDRVVIMLPNSAELYKKQIERGLGGDPRAALKARAILRKLCGTIVLEPEEDGSLWAIYDLQPAALLARGVTGGRGERI